MFLNKNQIDTLKNGLEKLNIVDIPQKVLLFDEYAKELYRWNEKTNLTRVKKDEVETRHFLDSLSVLECTEITKDDTLLDMGTGAGFPGLPLKIALPFLNVTLLDSSLKRIDFLNYVINKLNLKNVKAIHSRIEDYQKDNKEMFSIVTARALTNLQELLNFGMPFLKINGKMIFLKSLDDIKKEENTIKNYNTATLQITVKNKIVIAKKLV